MKKSLVFLSALILSLSLNVLHSQAGKPELSSDCLEKMKLRDEQFNEKIISDIILSFNLDIDESRYHKFTNRDLLGANLIYGEQEDDTYYNSLAKLFPSQYKGEPTLFVRPREAFLLYREVDDSNVMVHFKLKDKKWVVVEKKRKSGKPINFKLTKCEKEYIKKRNKYYKIK